MGNCEASCPDCKKDNISQRNVSNTDGKPTRRKSKRGSKRKTPRRRGGNRSKSQRHQLQPRSWSEGEPLESQETDSIESVSSQREDYINTVNYNTKYKPRSSKRSKRSTSKRHMPEASSLGITDEQPIDGYTFTKISPYPYAGATGALPQEHINKLHGTRGSMRNVAGDTKSSTNTPIPDLSDNVELESFNRKKLRPHPPLDPSQLQMESRHSVDIKKSHSYGELEWKNRITDVREQSPPTSESVDSTNNTFERRSSFVVFNNDADTYNQINETPTDIGKIYSADDIDTTNNNNDNTMKRGITGDTVLYGHDSSTMDPMASGHTISAESNTGKNNVFIPSKAITNGNGNISENDHDHDEKIVDDNTNNYKKNSFIDNYKEESQSSLNTDGGYFGSIRTNRRHSDSSFHSIFNVSAAVASRLENINYNHLISLNEKLEKRSGSIVRDWHWRWVCVRKHFVLWDKVDVGKKLLIKDVMDSNERRKWKSCISLTEVDEVKSHGDKHGRRFEIRIGKKTYHFRAENKQICIKWVNGLQKRMELLPKDC